MAEKREPETKEVARRALVDDPLSKLIKDDKRGREALLKSAWRLRDGFDLPGDVRVWLCGVIEQMVMRNENPQQAIVGPLYQARTYGYDSLADEKETLAELEKNAARLRAFSEAIVGMFPDLDSREAELEIKRCDVRKVRAEAARMASDKLKALGLNGHSADTIKGAVQELSPGFYQLDAIADELGISQGEALLLLIRATERALRSVEFNEKMVGMLKGLYVERPLFRRDEPDF